MSLSFPTLAEARRAALADGDVDGEQYGDEAMAIRAGQFPRNVTSQAYESTHVVKSGACTLYGFSGYSSRASSQFVQVHDVRGLPASGAVPVVVIAVTASSNFSYDAGMHGRRFLQGCVIVNSTTGPTYTAGAADTFFDVQYV